MIGLWLLLIGGIIAVLLAEPIARWDQKRKGKRK